MSHTLSGNVLSGSGGLGSLGDNSLSSGLGSTSWSVTNPVPQVPASCWSAPNFGGCQAWAISSPNADCQALAKAGNWDDESLKNCIEDKYRYRMINTCIGGCAAGKITYPGMPAAPSSTTSPVPMTILELQKALNLLLKPAGICALTEDGKLGAKTCGAAKMFRPDVVPTECASKGYTNPGPCAAVAPASTSSGIIVKPASAQVLPTSTASLLGSTKWIIGSSIAVAVGLVMVAIAKKKGMLK